MRSDDGENMSYKRRVEIGRLGENPVWVRPGVRVGRVTRDDYAIDFRVMLVDFVKKCHAGKTRHIEIGNDDCRAGIVADRLEGFVRICVDRYVSKSCGMQACGNNIGDVRHIVDDNDVV